MSPSTHSERVPSRDFPTFLRDTAEEPEEADLLTWILGVQGSGTNLLRRLLTKTFAFSVLKDRSMVFREAARLGSNPDVHAIERSIRIVRSRLFPSTLTRKTRRDYIKNNRPLQGIGPYLVPAQVRDGASLARSIYAYQACTLGTTRMAIKSDDLFDEISAIDEVIPNRRIILLTRDFRDNALSVGRKGWGPIDPLCAARWVKTRFAYYHDEYRRSPDSLHVRFETLVEEPRAFFEHFAEHFGLAPTVDPEDVLSTFPLKRNKTRRWERALSPHQLRLCEGILGPELETFGYELTTSDPRPPSPLEWAQARVTDTIRRIPQKLHTMGQRLRR